VRPLPITATHSSLTVAYAVWRAFLINSPIRPIKTLDVYALVLRAAAALRRRGSYAALPAERIPSNVH